MSAYHRVRGWNALNQSLHHPCPSSQPAPMPKPRPLRSRATATGIASPLYHTTVSNHPRLSRAKFVCPRSVVQMDPPHVAGDNSRRGK